MRTYMIVELGKRIDALIGYLFLFLLGAAGGYAWCWLALKAIK